MTRDRKSLAILAIGWLGFMAYAFPGFMSYDSCFQLQEARSGAFSDGHPPMMAVIWRFVDTIVAGPVGMLVIQSVCFLAGVYLVLRTRLSARASAIAASLVLWFPICASTMAVIWKDSQMAGYLALGAGFLVSQRRGVRVCGLAMIWLATAMRWNALAMTMPLVVLLFVWYPAVRWWKRYAVSIAAWLAITISAQVISSALVVKRWHVWTDGVALLDMMGTLRFAPDLDDSSVRGLLGNTPLAATHDLQATTRVPLDDWNFAGALWAQHDHLFKIPTTSEQRAAVTRAWKAVVLRYPAAYLRYRWKVFAQVLQLPDVPEDSRAMMVYQWFTDIQNLRGSAELIEHNASPSWLQEKLREGMTWISETWLFQAYLFMVLAIAILPFCRGDRPAFAILTSGVVGEGALFIVAPSPDWRYSFWLVAATVVGVVMLVARRAGARV